ncbi:hypothetical protein ACFFYR_16115 [Paraburkholderia dipogonis]|uniref:hypothetical protein n=1 Tax=Paraburkholderia dipogonis TaxID=1211383 RepID=UPI0035EDE8D8
MSRAVPIFAFEDRRCRAGHQQRLVCLRGVHVMVNFAATIAVWIEHRCISSSPRRMSGRNRARTRAGAARQRFQLTPRRVRTHAQLDLPRYEPTICMKARVHSR